jgi:hypothetical protein
MNKQQILSLAIQHLTPIYKSLVGGGHWEAYIAVSSIVTRPGLLPPIVSIVFGNSGGQGITVL